jgi:pyruvate,water dikinase
MMSHGSIVAREYGIPAVVGVPAATTVIRTGQRVTVDGTKGQVLLDSQAD